MSKLVWTSFAAALVFAGGMVLSAPGQRAAAQSGGVIVNAIDLDIAPAETEKYLAAVRENAAASVKEPGCREFNVHTLASNPNHVFLYEVYDNDAAAQAHRQTDHFKKYQATTANMVTGRSARPMTPVAFNARGK